MDQRPAKEENFPRRGLQPSTGTYTKKMPKRPQNGDLYRLLIARHCFHQNIYQARYMASSLPRGTVPVNGFHEGDFKTPFDGYK
jgi:hypothetical protein